MLPHYSVSLKEYYGIQNAAFCLSLKSQLCCTDFGAPQIRFRFRRRRNLEACGVLRSAITSDCFATRELANNALTLYWECLRRAKYIGRKQNNTPLLVNMVRQQFKRHVHETDPEKTQKLKDDAARGLINHILYESMQLSGRKMSKAA